MTNWLANCTADDTSFNRLVLKASLPTIALFVATWCDVCEPCYQTFARLASRYRDDIGFVLLDMDESQVITESFGIQAAPTYMLFRDGEPLAHGLGYLPEALLDRFFQRAMIQTSPSRGAWYPIEQEIEETLILPMLQRWGWVCQRQYQLLRRGTRTKRGIIDMLVSIDTDAPPLTLFENKRHITDQRALQRAIKQALSYAFSLELPSFVLADMAKLWVYQVQQKHATLIQEFTWLELEQDDSAVQLLLLQLNSTEPATEQSVSRFCSSVSGTDITTMVQGHSNT